MSNMFRLAVKDLRLLLREPMAAFFVFGFPVLMGLFFGLLMGGGSAGSTGKSKIALVDQDQSEFSRAFAESLRKHDNLVLETDAIESAQESVRRGERLGMLVVEPGFGQSAGILWEEPPTITLGMDPSRSAESAMLEGFVMEAVGQLIARRFQEPLSFRPQLEKTLRDVQADSSIGPMQKQVLQSLFGSIDTLITAADQLNRAEETSDDADGQNPDEPKAGAGARPEQPRAPTLRFANIERLDVTQAIDPKSVRGQLERLRSRWDISFPQAMLWGVMGCAAGFAASIAQERSRGTLLRLQAAPVSRLEILGGKALACLMAILLVIFLLVVLGVALGLRPGSYPKLALAGVAVAVCFVGVMMILSTLGKTEEAVSGTGWAANVVMAMIGGGMVPVMFMPAVIQKLSRLSPVMWSIRAIEGAIWREFSWAEMMPSVAVLVAVGLAGVAIGTWNLSRQLRQA